MHDRDTEAMHSVEEPFLSNHEKPRQSIEEGEVDFTLGSWEGARKKQWTIHLVLVILYTLSSVTAIHFSRGIPKGVNYQHPTRFIRFHQSSYAGPPSHDLDQAWHELLQNMTIRVSKHDLEKNNQSSVELPEEGGYLAWPGVYHELHCVKLLRQWNYRDYYYPNLTTKAYGDMEGHADHCLELLRQSAMCRADLSLTTFKWDQSYAVPIFNPEEHVHLCMDWDLVKASVDDRAVSERETDRLVNPLLESNSHDKRS